MLHSDLINTPCQKCNEGHYYEHSVRDDIEKILHCTVCHHRVDRYQNQDKRFEDHRLTLAE